MAVSKLTNQSGSISFPRINTPESSRYKDLTQQAKSIVNGKTEGDENLQAIGLLFCNIVRIAIAVFIGIAAYKVTVYVGVNKSISIVLGIVAGIWSF